MRSVRNSSFLAAAFVAIASACVPASEPRPPAGAGGFTVNPSEAASGKTFTRGAWTLTITKLIARVTLEVQPDPVEFPPTTELRGGYDQLVFDASKPLPLYAPGVSIGPAKADISLSPFTRYLGEGESTYDDEASAIDVSKEDVARFSEPAETSPLSVTNSQTSYYTGGNYLLGPSILLVVEGSYKEEHVTLKVAVNAATQSFGRGPTSSSSSSSSGSIGGDDGNTSNSGDDSNGHYHPSGLPLDIRANELALAALDVHPEDIFEDDISFGYFAEADDDHDGIVTGSELANHTTPITTGQIESSFTLLDVVTLRIGTSLMSARAN